jgi:hypothetical protein
VERLMQCARILDGFGNPHASAPRPGDQSRSALVAL